MGDLETTQGLPDRNMADRESFGYLHQCCLRMVLDVCGEFGVIQQSCLVLPANFGGKGPKFLPLSDPEINGVVTDLEDPTGLHLGTPFIDEGNRTLS